MVLIIDLVQAQVHVRTYYDCAQAIALISHTATIHLISLQNVHLAYNVRSVKSSVIKIS